MATYEKIKVYYLYFTYTPFFTVSLVSGKRARTRAWTTCKRRKLHFHIFPTKCPIFAWILLLNRLPQCGPNLPILTHVTCKPSSVLPLPWNWNWVFAPSPRKAPGKWALTQISRSTIQPYPSKVNGHWNNKLKTHQESWHILTGWELHLGLDSPRPHTGGIMLVYST